MYRKTREELGNGARMETMENNDYLRKQFKTQSTLPTFCGG